MEKVQKARISDVPQIHALVNQFAGRGEMLARPLSEIYETIRDFFVVRDGDRLIACAALHINWSDLAEIKSVAVAEDWQRRGLGAQVIGACVADARNLGIALVFCLTYKPAFFQKSGFSQVDKAELPRKVWTECYRCPKFPDCDEIALVRKLEVGAGV